MTGLGGRDLSLPVGASIEAPLPVGEHWVTAAGASVENGVIVYVHGGGFTHRNPPLMNLLAERISQATRRPALVVHYPLAPENPYPAPLDAVVDIYRALLGHIPADKVVFFSESSGAALALSAMLRLEAAEKPAGVITVSAVTDLSLQSASIDTNTASDAGVTRELLASFIGAYLAGAPADQAPQSPIFGDLREMPPLLLAVGGAEALLDDTMRFGEAAATVGVETRIDVYEGMPHAFSLSTLDEGHPTGRELLNRVGAWVR
ncbi:alpha/beta hydrolase [Actinoplanes sp. TBRC 11911]|nr:alpha/beta hydrolase [Actinoplanes sp. TBRC 11911]